MKMIKFVPALLLLACGCVSHPQVPKMKMAMGVPDGKVKYAPVPADNLSLQLLSKPYLYAGKSGSLIFALSNNGSQAISIPEWYAKEQDNITVFVQPWLTGMKEPHPDAWTKLDFELTQPVMHYPMTLLPGNKALINKNLEFIQHLKVSQGMERRYFVKAEMNLKSLKLSSKIITLRILPSQKSGEK